jgi:hypothetical protein
METRCQRCGTPAASDQAFCGRCGAVLGMVDDRSADASPELAATMVGAKLPPTPPAQRPATRPPSAHRPAAPPPAPQATARGSNTLILVAVGFVVVLLLGTLVLLFFLLGRG